MEIIDAKRQINWRKSLYEVYQYRELWLSLAYRDIRVKYAQTVLGLGWAIIEPLLSLIILSFVFNRVGKLSTEGFPPLLYGVSGIIAWTYFINVFIGGSASILGAQNLVKKIYFPRLIIPLSKSFSFLPDLAIGILFIIVAGFIFQIELQLTLLWFPIILLLLFIIAFGFGVWTAALCVRYRDFKYIIPFVTRIGTFATPIVYPATVVPEKYQLFFYMNPMAGIIELLRYSILGTTLNFNYVLISIAIGGIVLLTGIRYFFKVNRIIADII